jgi:hypothetical protein
LKWRLEESKNKKSKLIAFAESSFNKLASTIDKDGFAIPKSIFKKIDSQNNKKQQPFSNIIV